MGLDFKLLDTLLLLLNFADKVALVLPLGTHCRGARFQVLNLLVECCDTLLVALTAYGFTLDFELTDTAVERVQLLWLGVHFKTQSRCCLIDQIYRLVGQKSGGYVAVRKLHCRDYRLIFDTHFVVVFVSLFQTSQNRHGILGRRLLDHHLLEASFECLVLLEVFLKFVERSGSDSAQFASCKSGLQDVGSIHRSARFSGAYQGVNFVDEEQYFSLTLNHFVDYGFESLLKFSLVFGSRNQCSHIE